MQTEQKETNESGTFSKKEAHIAAGLGLTAGALLALAAVGTPNIIKDSEHLLQEGIAIKTGEISQPHVDEHHVDITDVPKEQTPSPTLVSPTEIGLQNTHSVTIPSPVEGK